jgi:hypothetical protein
MFGGFLRKKIKKPQSNPTVTLRLYWFGEVNLSFQNYFSRSTPSPLYHRTAFRFLFPWPPPASFGHWFRSAFSLPLQFACDAFQFLFTRFNLLGFQ